MGVFSSCAASALSRRCAWNACSSLSSQSSARATAFVYSMNARTISSAMTPVGTFSRKMLRHPK